MCPTIVLDSEGRSEMVIGGAGGTKITTATANNFVNKYLNQWDLGKSVSSGRLHHQLDPMILNWQELFDEQILAELKGFGHILGEYSYGTSFSPALFYDYQRGVLEAKGDNRRSNNMPAGH